MKPYADYKPSNVPWLGMVPSHWEIEKIRYRVKVNPGSTIRLAKDALVSFIPMEAISDDGKLELDRFRIADEVSSGYTYFEENDVTVAKITPCFENGKGAVMQGLIGGAGYGTTELIVMRPDERVLPEWLYYFTMCKVFRSTGEAMMLGAGGQKRIPDIFMKDFSVAFPPIPEQTAIVEYLNNELNRIDILFHEKNELIGLLKEWRLSFVSQAVTKGIDSNTELKPSGVLWLGDVPAHWSVKQIKRLSPVRRGASPRPIDDPIYFDDNGDYGWVRIEDVTRSNGILLETTQYLSALGASLSVKMSPGQLFLSIAGSVGKPCIAGRDVCIHDGFVYFPDLEIDTAWMFRIFESGLCFQGLGKMGTQLNLNTQTVGDIFIAIPPADEIKSIIENLDSESKRIDALITHTQDEIALLKELRAATIADAVLGRIDVRTQSHH